MDVEVVRNQRQMKLLATQLQCQPKDAPVLIAAYEQPPRVKSVTIYTNDESFAKTDAPEQRDAPDVTLVHVT